MTKQVMEGYKQMFDQTIVTVWCVCASLHTAWSSTSEANFLSSQVGAELLL